MKPCALPGSDGQNNANLPGKFHTILLLAFGLKAILLIPLSGQEIPDSMMMQEYPVENPLSRPEI